MNDDDELRQDQPGPSLAEIGFAWFLRIVAAYSLMFGILYWIRLIGFYPGLLWRFDLMPLQWQAATVTLAVLFPFAAIGLWMLTAWGAAVWFLCAVIEMVMYVGMPEIFGNRQLIVLSHAAVMLLYVAFRFVIYRQHMAVAQ